MDFLSCFLPIPLTPPSGGTWRSFQDAKTLRTERSFCSFLGFLIEFRCFPRFFQRVLVDNLSGKLSENCQKNMSERFEQILLKQFPNSLKLQTGMVSTLFRAHMRVSLEYIREYKWRSPPLRPPLVLSHDFF